MRRICCFVDFCRVKSEPATSFCFLVDFGPLRIFEVRDEPLLVGLVETIERLGAGVQLVQVVLGRRIRHHIEDLVLLARSPPWPQS